MKFLNTNDHFLNKTFTIELTGEELVRLWNLSWAAEGGNQHAKEDWRRFNQQILEFLGMNSDQMSALFDHFQNGYYKGP